MRVTAAHFLGLATHQSPSPASMDVDELLSNHSREDRGPAVLGGCIIGIICCVLAVAVRLTAQASIHRLWTGDSILIVCAAILSLAVAACTIAAQKNGLGRHEYWVMKEDPHPPERTAFIFEMGYVVTVLQASALMFTKLSILLFYHRAFTTVLKSVRYAINVLFVFCVGLGVGTTIAFICACVPQQMFWLRVYSIFGYQPPEPLRGQCEPQQLHLGVPLLLDLASEIVLLTIPAIVMWNLQLPLRKKVAVIFTFSLGGFVTAISAVRFYYAWMMENGGDLSWDDTDTFLWTAVQLSFGVVTACIPASAPLLRRVQSSRRRPSDWSYGLTRPIGKKITPAKLKAIQRYHSADSEADLAPNSWEGNEPSAWTTHCEGNLPGAMAIPMNSLEIEVSQEVQVQRQ